MWKTKITRAGDAAVNRLAERNWESSIWNELLQEAQTFGRASKMLEEPSRQSMLALVQSVINELNLQAQIRTVVHARYILCFVTLEGKSAP